MNLINGATDKTVLDRFMKLDISDCGKVMIFFYSIRLLRDSQLISKGLFGVFHSPKKRTKNVCPSSRLGQKFKFSSFWGELKALKKHFEIN